MSTRRLFGFALATLTWAAHTRPATAQASFQGLGDLPGGTVQSIAYGISADGTVVVGWGSSSSGRQAFVWTQAAGMVGLPEFPGAGFHSEAWDVSPDGTVIVGFGTSINGTEACRWTYDSGSSAWVQQSLGDLPGGGFYSIAADASDDGSVMVGRSQSQSSGIYSEAFVGSAPAGPITGLGYLPGAVASYAEGVSADGTVAVGFCLLSNGIPVPFRWAQAAGMELLPDLPGGTIGGVAREITPDGLVIVGASESANSTPGDYAEACRWIYDPNTQAWLVEGLGDLPPTQLFSSQAFAVSGDGSIAVGAANQDEPDGVPGEAFIWDPVNGMRSLKQVLFDLGVSQVASWELAQARGMSDDGTVIVGTGTHNGASEAWVATLPSVQIAAANPPTDDPFTPGTQPFRDVLQNTTTGLAPEGIGAGGTPALPGIGYSNPRVTFSGLISPAPLPGNITVSCTDLAGNGPGDCPSVTAVAPGAAANEYVLTLSGPIPPRECTTLTFLGTAPGQKLQYQSLPGDVNLNGTTTGQDVLALVLAINNGTAGVPANLPRYDINRNGGVTGQDVVRLVQLLNGGATVSPATGYINAMVAACP